MDDLLFGLLMAVAVIIAIPISVLLVFVSYLAYRKSLISKIERQIEIREANKKLRLLEKEVCTPRSKIDYPQKWDSEHKIDEQTTFEKQKLYEEELKRNELQALEGIIPKLRKE